MHDPAEVDDGDARATRSSGLIFVGLLLGAVLVAVLLDQVGQTADPNPSKRPPAAAVATTTTTTICPDLPATPEPDRPIGVESIRQCTVPLGGLALGDRRQVPEPALERWNCDALRGPWSVVIRATDGHFGVHGAVVTFPVDRWGAGTAVAKPRGAVWSPGAQQLVWPLAGSHAQIVGDVGQTQLADLAMRITVETGRPHLAEPDGFAAGYGSLATTTHLPPVVHEMRYSTKDLGQESRFGDGLVYTGLMSGASLESQAFEARAKPAGFVRGYPAIYSDVPGGNGTLAWESAPGEVTYIGFSGSATLAGAKQADAIEALRGLADSGRPLTPAQWQAKDRTASCLAGGQTRSQWTAPAPAPRAARRTPG